MGTSSREFFFCYHYDYNHQTFHDVAFPCIPTFENDVDVEDEEKRLAREAKAAEEAELALCKQTYIEVYKQFVSNKCNTQGEQRSNLEPAP